MRSINELEKEIEKTIIETLSSYRQIKVVLENTDYTPEQKIKYALWFMKRFRMVIQNKFNFISEGKPVDDLVFSCDSQFTENLEELKLEMLYKIMNAE